LIFCQLIRKRAVAVENVAFAQREVVFRDFRANNRTRANQHSAQVAFVLCAVDQICRNWNNTHADREAMPRDFRRKLVAVKIEASLFLYVDFPEIPTFLKILNFDTTLR
jgi:hypothetical protein